MKIKIHWGFGITVFYIVFVLLILGSLVFASLQKSDLVSNDYYKNEIEYQKQIDKGKRTKKLPQQIKILQQGNTVVLSFPFFQNEAVINGDIVFYRPSNGKLDKKFRINLNKENVQIIDISSFAKGLWKIKIDWVSGGVSYFNEESVTL